MVIVMHAYNLDITQAVLQTNANVCHRMME